MKELVERSYNLNLDSDELWRLQDWALAMPVAGLVDRDDRLCQGSPASPCLRRSLSFQFHKSHKTFESAKNAKHSKLQAVRWPRQHQIRSSQIQQITHFPSAGQCVSSLVFFAFSFGVRSSVTETFSKQRCLDPFLHELAYLYRL